MSAAIRASVLLLLALGVSSANAQTPLLTPFKTGGIYRLGEKAGWTVTWPAGSPAENRYRYTIKRNAFEEIKTGTLDFSSPPVTIDVVVNEPAMLFLELFPDDPKAMNAKDRIAVAGAAIAPERLQPVAPAPADFDRFWHSKIKMLESIRTNPVLTPSPSGRDDVDYATVRLDHINGTHVYGQLAKPKRKGKFPGVVIFQWASPPYPLQKPWVTDRAAEGWLALNIEPHDVLPDQPPSYYEALPAALKNYQAIGRDDRDRNYFLQMYLADYRAVEYLASRPDWDGRTLLVMGTSMGGQQALCTAAFNRKVTALVVNVPAGADALGPLNHRSSGFPNWPVDDPKVIATAPYFDTVNCASRIKVPSFMAMGFVDTTTPPAGIWTAFNQIRAPKEAAPMFDSPHNHLATPAQLRPYVNGSSEWLAALLRGDETPLRADRAAPRLDENSRIAHLQLVQKARSGRIDVYFEGDSITRRWGTSDSQYRSMLDHWNQSFFGWNAADFGWGADKTQNILWRLKAGELAGVNPKVIVLMAGTNNVGNQSPLGDADQRVADVTRGIEAIVAECRRLAPGAVIIVVGITPRNDNPDVMPIIDGINQRLERFADGRKVRFLNLNRQLADSGGRLHPGMTGPDLLHLAVPGYQVWADALKPILTELLGPPAAVDLAPKPTGDPSAVPVRP